MKNGSLESRKAAKGSFGGSLKAKRKINFSLNIAGPEGTTKTLHRSKEVGRDYKGAAGAKAIRKLQKSSLLF